MTTATTKTEHVPEDLLTMPDGDRYELVNGKLVERNMSMLSSYIAGVVYALLFGFCRPKKLGWVFPEGTNYQCFEDDPSKVRKPDVSFIRLERLSPEQAAARGHARLTPDLAVEVVSPNDLYYDVELKAQEWLDAGAKLVWVVNPATRSLTIHRADGTSLILHEQDELTGEDIVPGFRCPVRELFLLPTEAATS
jgi:Uma2 family endonuclease